MSGKGRAQKKSKPRTSQDMGIFAPVIPVADDDDDDIDDGDLEAELDMILSSGPQAKSPRKSGGKKPVPQIDLDRMVAESMKDIPSDASLSDDDNDPGLLEELALVTGGVVEEKEHTIQPVTPSSLNVLQTIKERIQMYTLAEENAKSVGDSTKARRLGRGLKTLKELMRNVESGKDIDENDIPPLVSVSAKKVEEKPPQPLFEPLDLDSGAPVPAPAPAPAQVPPIVAAETSVTVKTKPKTDPKIMEILTTRRDEYKKAAVEAKRNGDNKTALSHVKIVKQFDSVISSAAEGQPVDISTIPPPPGATEIPQTPPSVPAPPPEPAVSSPPPPPKEEPKVPTTVLEALEQRLAKFQEQEEAGKKEGNSSKVRRMGRICKQYQDAIKLHKAGKPIPVDELPTPPGFAPIPVAGAAAPAPAPPQITPRPAPPIPSRTIPSVPQDEPGPSKPSQPPTVPSPSQQSTRQDKQMKLLQVKQKQFKEAALKAKQNGDIALAKEYLKLSRGIDPLIEATKNGLPVDFSTLPPPPGSSQQLEKDYEIVQTSDCIPGTMPEIYNQLMTDLQHQLKVCMETRAHFKAIGDVGSANKFEQLAVITKKDLDTVKIAWNKQAPIPKFHYEKRTFDIVHCNTDLNDNDVELSIIQGINYNVPNPKEIDTYIRFEFPYPTDDPKKDKTSTIYNTNNPKYDAVFLIPIQRTNRACQRIFKRHSIKLEVWSKGFILSGLCSLCSLSGSGSISGFLRADTLVGTVNVKLQPLETKCSIHDSFELMDGRKSLGGKLEVKVRIRHPIAAKQVSKIEEKWLVID